jgi:hypothetical protein
MLFLVLRLLKFGYRQNKKRNVSKQQAHSDWSDINNPTTNNNDMQFPRQLLSAGGAARSPAKTFAEAFIRFFQFILGLTVIGLYGVDLSNAQQKQISADPKWVYAEMTGALGTIMGLVHLVTLFTLKNRPLALRPAIHLPLFIWECVLCIFWLTLFGIFGKLYISEDPEGDSGIVRMKHAVWVDLTNLMLWTITATWCGVRWWSGQRGMPVADDGKAEEVGY